MKKYLSLLLAVALTLTLLPTTVLAYDQYVVYAPQTGCQLTNFVFAKSVNPWLIRDITFNTHCDGRALVNSQEHPNLIGQAVKPTFSFEGTSVTFNGETIVSGETAVTLRAENELIVYGNNTKAEYQVNIEDINNGIPVVLIDTNGAAIPDKVNYVDTAITILGADVYGGEDMYAVTGGIKLRGNSTSAYDKKPYRIKFDKKQDVFGLGKAKSWVLLANHLDPAGIRNDLAYAFSTRMSTLTAQNGGIPWYVPRTRPVEVYLNGEYRGLYDLGDHVQVDGTRIDIDESGDEFDDNDVQLFPEGNVGYYLEIEHATRVIPEWYSENAYYVTIKNSGGVGTETLYTGGLNEDGSLETAGKGTSDTLYVQIKTPEIPSQEQIDYITDYLQTVNDLILAKDERVWNYIDKDSFINWYLANELFKNTDSAFLSSIKMHKDKDGKLRMGPVWDFDIGSGAVAYNGVEDPTGWLTRDNSRCGWYNALFSMPTFTEAVEERWASLHRAGILEQITTDIDALYPYLKKAGNADYTLWHDTYVNDVNSTGWLIVSDICLSGTWQTQVQYLRNYMQGRIRWMDEQFGYASSTVNTLIGDLSIIGSPEIEHTLMAGTFNIRPASGLVYQWYRNGTAISGARKSTYTLTSADVGCNITVKVASTTVSGQLISAPVTVTMQTNNYKTTQIPPFVSKTKDTIVVSERTGYEISVDGVNWQMSGTFTGLQPNTLYAVRYRHTALNNKQVGLPGNATYIITDPDELTHTVGDINQDGTVNMLDALALYNHVSGKQNMTCPIILGDITKDDTINMLDILALYNTLSGK